MLNINMTQQDTFDIYPREQLLGAIADNSITNPVSTILKDGQAITFGDALCKSSQPHLSEKFSGSNTFFKGIYFRRFNKVGGAIGGTAVNPKAGLELMLLLYGRVWVKASNAVTEGDKACLTPAGLWAGGSVTGNFILDGATFLTSGAKDELVKLELTGGRHLTAIS